VLIGFSFSKVFQNIRHSYKENTESCNIDYIHFAVEKTCQKDGKNSAEYGSYHKNMKFVHNMHFILEGQKNQHQVRRFRKKSDFYDAIKFVPKYFK